MASLAGYVSPLPLSYQMRSSKAWSFSKFTLIFLLSCTALAAKPIHESKAIPIGGIRQWISLKGEDAIAAVRRAASSRPRPFAAARERSRLGGWLRGPAASGRSFACGARGCLAKLRPAARPSGMKLFRAIGSGMENNPPHEKVPGTRKNRNYCGWCRARHAAIVARCR